MKKLVALICFLLLTFSTPALANDVRTAQQLLTELGYNPGPVDGSYGGKTEQALIKFYAAQNKKFDGKLSANEIKDLESSLSVSIAARPKLKKSRHRQHAKYAKHIATPFRNLKVNKSFTLIDDFNSFMGFHESELKGKLDDSKGSFNIRRNQGFDFNFCVEDFITTTTKKANPSKGVQNVGAYCGQMISQRFLNNPESGLEHYRKIILGWLENGIVQNPNAFSKKVPNKLMSEWPYAISSNVPNILSHYAIYHRLYSFDQFTHQRILRMGEAFYAQWDYYPELIKGGGDYKRKLCNLKSQTKVVLGTNDHCGSFSFRMATGGIYFGLEFNSQIAFDTGIRHLEVMLATFNKDAVFAAQAHRGICAVGYMKQFPPHIELIHYAFLKAFGIDFINIKNINGVTPSEVYTKLWKIAHDPLETVVKYWNGFDQMNCSDNGKNQAEMVAQLKKDPNSYSDIWNGFNYQDFLLASPILAQGVLPSEWSAMDKKYNQLGKWLSVNISGNDYMGISPYLLQLALGNFEDERKEYAIERKKKEVELKRKREEVVKKKEEERLRNREMLFLFDGVYKVQLGIERNVINGKMYQNLGSILFTLNGGQPKLDENNILYQALGLNTFNFSLDHDGDMVVSGQISDEMHTGEKCVYIAGNLRFDKQFNPKSSQYCGENNQSLSMKIEKISDDVNLDLVNEKELKKLDGEYDVQWFIKGINSTERTLRAKDKLILSNGIGMFKGNETNKQPSSELRKELSVQHNANGEIVIIGRIDLLEKTVVKKWYASGEIHPIEKTTIKTVWGLGDIIELEIEKTNFDEKSKEKEVQTKAFIYNDYFLFDEMNSSYQLKRHSEITGINQIDFSLNHSADDEELFGGDISYTTSANNFGITWTGLKVKKTDEVSHNIKIAFQIEERSFPNFAEAFSTSKNECGVFEDMVDDSFIIPLKTDNLIELELFDCHVKVLQENLNKNDFGILENRINTAISLVDTIEVTNKYFPSY